MNFIRLFFLNLKFFILINYRHERKVLVQVKPLSRNQRFMLEQIMLCDRLQNLTYFLNYIIFLFQAAFTLVFVIEFHQVISSRIYLLFLKSVK